MDNQLKRMRPVNKRTQMQGNAKVALIEQPELLKHAQPANRRPISNHKCREVLKECLLSNHKRKTKHNPYCLAFSNSWPDSLLLWYGFFSLTFLSRYYSGLLCTQHLWVLDDFCAQLNQCLHDSALSSLPKANRSSVTPGWNINARRLKEAANFWHDICRQFGCPSHGVLH